MQLAHTNEPNDAGSSSGSHKSNGEEVCDFSVDFPHESFYLVRVVRGLLVNIVVEPV
jgi:hypothetical protein